MILMSIYKLVDWADIEKINWNYLSVNKNAISVLEKNPDRINWSCLSVNKNAISILENNIDKINWEFLSSNVNIIELDFKSLKEQLTNSIREELMMKIFHPLQFERYLNMNYNICDDRYL